MFEADLSINFIAFMIIRTLFNKGSRVPLRGKVNEAVTTGVRVVEQSNVKGLIHVTDLS